MFREEKKGGGKRKKGGEGKKRWTEVEKGFLSLSLI